MFHIGVTFDKSAVLNGIRLFIDNSKLSENFFISNGDGGEESKIEKRQRERESVCVCEAAHSRKGQVALVIK
jgi:hypothetical protein